MNRKNSFPTKKNRSVFKKIVNQILQSRKLVKGLSVGTSAMAILPTLSYSFQSPFELSSLLVNGNMNGFAINGITTTDQSGRSVSSAGDVNGDGWDDIIVGAMFADPNGSYSGQSYVVFGKSGDFPSPLELPSLNGVNGFAINGITNYDFSGISVSDAGDVNGDGFDDLIVGASGAAPNGSLSGQSYVIFGKSNFAPSFELSSLTNNPATNGFIINGIAKYDNSGFSVSKAGDVNGDGFDDLVIGASYVLVNGNFKSGQSYVVFGTSNLVTSPFELSSLTNNPATNGFAINGISSFDYSGFSVSDAGDVNGDGFDDIIIGSYHADPHGESSGQSYVVFGTSNLVASPFELSSLLNNPATNGFVINGIAPGDYSGISVSSAGDVNGDSFDDLMIGATLANPNGFYSGQSYVVFGRSNLVTSPFELSSLLNNPATNGFVINGITNYDYSGSSVSSVGDINDDGFDDIIIGAHKADPNGKTNAGQSYVVFGTSNPITSPFELSSLANNSATDGFAINGINLNDQSGRSSGGAGDVNGDGIDDLIIGTRLADPNGKTNAGQSYVIFGEKFFPMPEINVMGNGQTIIDGDATPDLSDDTDFGTVMVGNTVDRTYTIQNQGTGDLTINLPVADPGNGFTIVSQPVATIGAGASTTITVRFAPLAAGTFNTILNIVNSDSDENSYNFTIQGIGIAVPAPEINVIGNSQTIIDEDATPDLSDNTDFGTVMVGNTIDRTYTIQNQGTGDLTINLPVADPGNGFTIVSQSANIVPPGGSTTLTVKFTPPAAGLFNAILNIENNDSNESPYNFALRGTGTTNTPIIRFDIRLQRYILWIPPCDISPPGPGWGKWAAKITSGHDLAMNLTSKKGERLPIEGLSQRPTHGSVKIEKGELIYSPNKGFLGTDTFVFEGKSESGIVCYHQLNVEIQE